MKTGNITQDTLLTNVTRYLSNIITVTSLFWRNIQGRIQSFERGGGGAPFWKTVEDQKNLLKTSWRPKKKKKVTTIIASYPYLLYHVCYVKYNPICSFISKLHCLMNIVTALLE